MREIKKIINQIEDSEIQQSEENSCKENRGKLGKLRNWEGNSTRWTDFCKGIKENWKKIEKLLREIQQSKENSSMKIQENRVKWSKMRINRDGIEEDSRNSGKSQQSRGNL